MTVDELIVELNVLSACGYGKATVIENWRNNEAMNIAKGKMVKKTFKSGRIEYEVVDIEDLELALKDKELYYKDIEVLEDTIRLY